MSLPIEIWRLLFPTPAKDHPIAGRSDHWNPSRQPLRFFTVGRELGSVVAGTSYSAYVSRIRFVEEKYRLCVRDFVRFGLICRATMRLVQRFLSEAFLCECFDLSVVYEARYADIYPRLITALFDRMAFFLRDGLRELQPGESNVDHFNLETPLIPPPFVHRDRCALVGHVVIETYITRAPICYWKAWHVVHLCLLMMKHGYYHLVCLFYSNFYFLPFGFTACSCSFFLYYYPNGCFSFFLSSFFAASPFCSHSVSHFASLLKFCKFGSYTTFSALFDANQCAICCFPVV
jgi:hypothetical protein